MNKSEGIKYFYKRIHERDSQYFLTSLVNHSQPSIEAAAKRLSDFKEASKSFKSALERLNKARS